MLLLGVDGDELLVNYDHILYVAKGNWSLGWIDPLLVL